MLVIHDTGSSFLCKDDCVIPIPDAKNLRQAQDNAGAIGERMTAVEMARLDRVAQ